jgi:hypothetical protein
MRIKGSKKCIFIKYINGSNKRISNTNIYRSLDYMNVKSARKIARILGYTRWFSAKRSPLLSSVVIGISANIIQKFMKSWFENSKYICPISLTPMTQIPLKYRYFHTNTWFDKRKLSEFIDITCDFNHPSTRLEFTEEDVVQIDPSLVKLFRSRVSIRSEMKMDMETIQSLENEMEQIFSEIINVAYQIQNFNEFKIVFGHWHGKLNECFWDLVQIDIDRCRLAVKSLNDLIPHGPYDYVHMSYNRKRFMEATIRGYIVHIDSDL